ncbi:haloacid dehalogenase-like hydrolase [Galbitalea sp. SE-J8]|uniref:HAD family hydrolase n=1 Tax=Galbitalea sp. SE-J8 TaxID=3054952 RepID=UPI00259D1E1B|nr:HAD family hydrolase [Galbitalea sp. SE-J8]MDM4761816.1 haloacid dehalogenase-like hydrolase [Galbitalea sp. SE-J8]
MPAEPARYLLWDVDGTLVFNGADAGNLYHEAVELAAGRTIADRMPNTHGKTDAQILAETLAHHGLPDTLRQAAALHLDELSRLRHERGEHRTLCPGADAALRAAAAHGWTNGLLTGNGRQRSAYKLAGAGLDLELIDWDRSFFGDTTLVRADLTRRAAAALDGPAVIVGDTPNDGVAADAAGFAFIAVATGAFARDDLAATSARVVLDDLQSGHGALLAALADLPAR